MAQFYAKTLKTKEGLLISLGVVAGIFYNSWPLGYVLNPTVAQHALASELEALHQPFNWVFVAADILCSLLVLIVAFGLWLVRNKLNHSLFSKVAIINFGLFGVGTIVDALLPLSCDPTVQTCPITIHDPLLIAHGFFSIGASLCLFVAVSAAWWRRRYNPLLNGIMIGYILFAIFSIISIVTPGQDSWAQHYALILDGVCLAAIPYELLLKKPTH